MINEYIFLGVYIILSLILCVILLLLSYILGEKNYDNEKISAYECGFNPFEDTNKKFDVRFYLVGILFIIFDLEVMFLFPWSLSLSYTNVIGFITGIIFIVILTVGLVYELKKKAMDW